jgi:putative transposase
VNRDFTAAAPGEKMVGDITYIPTWQGWVVAIQLESRLVVGYGSAGWSSGRG